MGNADELELEAVRVPGDLSSAAFLIAAGVLVPGARLVLEGVGVNWTRTGFLRILQRMGAIVVGELEEPGAFAAAEPVCDLDVSYGPIEATTVDADEVPLAIDELPLVALLGCFAEGETVVRGAAELRVKESDRIATVVDGLRGLGADIEALQDGFAVRGQRRAARRAHRRPRRPPPRAAGGGRRTASQEGVEVVGMEAAEVSYPGFADDIAALAVGLMVVAIDGPAGAGKSTVARAVAQELGFTYLDSGAMYRSVALAALRARRPPAEVAPTLRIELGERVLPRRPRRHRRRSAPPEVTEAASVAAAAARGARGDGRRAAPAALGPGDWVAEGRDIGTVVAPQAEVKVFLTASPQARAQRRAAELGVDTATVLAEQTIRDERDTGREHSPLLAAPDAHTVDTTDLTLPEVVARIVALVAARR